MVGRDRIGQGKIEAAGGGNRMQRGFPKQGKAACLAG